MSSQRSVQISSRRGTERPSLEQQRFSFLLAEIEKARLAEAKKDAFFLKFRQENSEKLAPLRATLRATCAECVFALDRLLGQPGWARLDRTALEDMLRSTAEILLQSGDTDERIKSIYDKYSSVGFDDRKDEELEQLKEQAEEMGFDLGDPDSIRSADDLMQRMYEEMAAREEAEEAKRASKKAKRKTAAQQRSEDNAKLAKQTIRDLYRKLASAVHPDRERDPQRREEKNLLMQRINQAYASNDLMALLEAQSSIERMDPERPSDIGATRLKHYNKLLAEQLAALKEKLKEMEAQFCMDLGLPSTAGLTPAMLARLTREQARAMRSEVTRQQQLLNLLRDKAATKRWLKQQRRFARGEFDFDDPDSW
jgi:hypothetical protein